MVYSNLELIADKFHITKRTAQSRVKELEQHIGTRYPEEVIIDDGKIKLVNDMAFIDWMFVRKRMQDPVAKKTIKPYSPARWRQVMALTREEIVK